VKEGFLDSPGLLVHNQLSPLSSAQNRARGVLWARKNPAKFASLAYKYFLLQISQTPLSLTQASD
jgi:hypothetical protein